jgi:hypothetical protein
MHEDWVSSPVSLEILRLLGFIDLPLGNRAMFQ